MSGAQGRLRPPPPHYGTALRRRHYVVRAIAPARARALVERYHYAGGVGNTGTVILGLFRVDDPTQTCLGAVWFMPPPLGSAKRVGGAHAARVLMLSRTVLIPSAPRNSATFLLGAAIRHIRALRDAEGGQRWWHLVTYADEYMAKQPTHLRIPGGIYRGSNFTPLGRGDARVLWRDRTTGRLVSRYSAGRTYTRGEMTARGCEPIGRFALWAFVYDLTLPPHEQTRRAHAARDLLPRIVYQLPMVA